MIKAICFDLGGTIWNDYPQLLRMWESLCRILTGRGFPTSMEYMHAQARKVIAGFTPSLTRAIVWQRVDGDTRLYRQIMDEVVRDIHEYHSDPDKFRALIPLFPGIHELLGTLAGDYKLAVISQHFSEVEHWMSYHGIGGYFDHLSISGKERLYKPDPRLFLSACSALRVEPEQAVMVGDRLDNDIWPANRIGMTTIRVLADPYRIQNPRYHRDVPDYTIEHTAGLTAVLQDLK